MSVSKLYHLILWFNCGTRNIIPSSKCHGHGVSKVIVVYGAEALAIFHLSSAKIQTCKAHSLTLEASPPLKDCSDSSIAMVR